MPACDRVAAYRGSLLGCCFFTPRSGLATLAGRRIGVLQKYEIAETAYRALLLRLVQAGFFIAPKTQPSDHAGFLIPSRIPK